MHVALARGAALRWIAALLLFTVLGALAPLSSPEAGAQLEPAGGQLLSTGLALDDLKITRDWSDGGQAELCVEARFSHGGQTSGAAGSEWLRLDCWDNLQLGAQDKSSSDTPPKLASPFTLIGSGANVPQWLSPMQRECAPSGTWEIRLRVVEIDATNVAAIVGKVGQAIGDEQESRALLSGALLQGVGPLLDQLFAAHQEVGTSRRNWPAGAGDQEGEAARTGSADSFTYGVKKIVSQDRSQDPATCGSASGGSSLSVATTSAQTSAQASDATPTRTPTPASGSRSTSRAATPTPTPTSTGSRSLTQPSGGTQAGVRSNTTGYDELHPFSRSVAGAERSWNLLTEAAQLVDDVARESGARGSTAFDATGQQALLLQLIAVVGRYPTTVALAEASVQQQAVPAATVQQAQAALVAGDQLAVSAVANARTNDLIAALEYYSQAFEVLAPLLYPDANRR
jgi:hypothetical protein